MSLSCLKKAKKCYLKEKIVWLKMWEADKWLESRWMAKALPWIWRKKASYNPQKRKQFSALA